MCSAHAVQQMQVIGQYALLEELMCQIALSVGRVVDVFQKYRLVEQGHPGSTEQRECTMGVDIEFSSVIHMHDHDHGFRRLGQRL